MALMIVAGVLLCFRAGAGSLRGIVIDRASLSPEGAGIDNVMVTVVDKESGQTLGEPTWTDADGRFGIENLRAGLVTVHFDKPRYLPKPGKEDIDLVAGENTTTLRLIQKKPTDPRYYQLLAASMQIAAGNNTKMYVEEFRYLATIGWPEEARTATLASLKDLVPVNQYAMISAYDDPRPSPVRGWQHVVASSFSGSITATGSAVPGVQVTAVSDMGRRFTTTTNAQGRFTFRNLPVGLYDIKMTMEGLRTVESRVRVDAGGSHAVRFATSLVDIEEGDLASPEPPVIVVQPPLVP